MKNNSSQFALAPFAPQPSIPVISIPNGMQPDSSLALQNDMEGMYPDVYHDVYPLVAEAVNQLLATGITPTAESVDSIVDNIIRNSGMWYEDDDESSGNQGFEAIPVQGGFGRSPYRRRRRRHHSRNTLRDIVKILLLGELSGRGGRRHHGYY